MGLVNRNAFTRATASQQQNGAWPGCIDERIPKEYTRSTFGGDMLLYAPMCLAKAKCLGLGTSPPTLWSQNVWKFGTKITGHAAH